VTAVDGVLAVVQLPCDIVFTWIHMESR